MGPAQNVRWSLKIGENEDDGSERQRAATAIAATTKLCDVTHLWCNSIFPHSRQIQSNLSVDDCIYVRHGLVPTFYQFCPCERWSPLTRSVRVCMCVSTLKTWVSAPMHSSGTQQIFLYVIIVAPMVAIIIKSQCLASIGIANFLSAFFKSNESKSKCVCEMNERVHLFATFALQHSLRLIFDRLFSKCIDFCLNLFRRKFNYFMAFNKFKKFFRFHLLFILRSEELLCIHHEQWF